MPIRKQTILKIIFLDYGNSGVESLKLLLFEYFVGLMLALFGFGAIFFTTDVFNTKDYNLKLDLYLYFPICVLIMAAKLMFWQAINKNSRRNLALLLFITIIPIPISAYLFIRDILHPRPNGFFFACRIISKCLIEIIRLQGILVILRCYTKLGSPLMSRLQEFSEHLEENKYEISKLVQIDPEEEEIVGHEKFSKFLISPLELTIDPSTILGEGEYGRVFKGCLVKKSMNFIHKNRVDVAVKVVNNPEDPLRFQMLLQEIKIMILVGDHENIVHFFGVTSDASIKEHLAIITEFCELSSLERFLGKTRHTFVNLLISKTNFGGEREILDLEMDPDSPLEYVNLEEHGTHTTLDLIRIACEIANGMEYLSSKKVIHGDLAARNILLGSERRVKVADFGLAHRLYNYQIYSKIESQQSFLPWRWMAVEAIEDLKFSEESDVWSFGVVLWEIFTLGEMPFKEIQWSQNFPKLLRNGLKLPKPRFGSYEMYKLMRQCWEIEPTKRPKFGDIKVIVRSILEKCS